MYAVIRIAGKQFRVAPEDHVKVPLLPAEVGAEVRFDEVLACAEEGRGLTVGAPLVQGALVTARVEEPRRDRKILVFHKKRRKDHRKKNGHRQPYSQIRITGIQLP